MAQILFVDIRSSEYLSPLCENPSGGFGGPAMRPPAYSTIPEIRAGGSCSSGFNALVDRPPGLRPVCFSWGVRQSIGPSLPSPFLYSAVWARASTRPEAGGGGRGHSPPSKEESERGRGVSPANAGAGLMQDCALLWSPDRGRQPDGFLPIPHAGLPATDVAG